MTGLGTFYEFISFDSSININVPLIKPIFSVLKSVLISEEMINPVLEYSSICLARVDT